MTTTGPVPKRLTLAGARVLINDLLEELCWIARNGDCSASEESEGGRDGLYQTCARFCGYETWEAYKAEAELAAEEDNRDPRLRPPLSPLDFNPGELDEIEGPLLKDPE